MQLGSAELTIVSDGTFRMDGGSLFGPVPKAIWSRRLAPDRKNRVEVALNCLLIRAGGKNVLVDTGVGTKHGPRARSIFGMRGGKLARSLAAQGLGPRDIDLVVLTHLHFDHAGGCTCYRRGSGQLVPVFPKAIHLAQRAEFREATETNERTGPAYNPDDFIPLEDNRQLELLDGDTELLPGLWARHTGGHTAGHQMFYLESQGEKAACFGDIVPIPEHLPLNYLTAFDLYPMDTLEAKRRWLAEAERDNWLVIFGHSVATQAGRLTRNEAGRPSVRPVALD